MTATLIILPLLAAGLFALAVYEWHVSPWELHAADLTLDCLPELLADRPDLRDAIEHDTAWISFPTHPDRREGGHHGDKANKHDRG